MGEKRQGMRCVGVMAKAPVSGKVKTRLCPPLDFAQAATVASALLEDTWRAVTRDEATPAVLVLDGSPEAVPASLQMVDRIAQVRGDLGERMEAAAKALFAAAERVVLVGSDIPGIPSHYLDAAFASLEHSDVVLGPSGDGGFYLIGFSQFQDGMLGGLPWSSEATLRATIQQLVAGGFGVAQVDAFDDIDTASDLQRLHTEVVAGTVVAPATARWLASYYGIVSHHSDAQ